MATVIGGDLLEQALKKIGDRIGRAREVRVGFLEGSVEPDGSSTAEVAAINEYGAPEAGIPARPFFSGMIAEKSPEWGDKFAKLLELSDYDTSRALRRMGDGIATQLRKAIIDFKDPPNAPSTIAKKGFDDPLVDTGSMLNSVDREVE